MKMLLSYLFLINLVSFLVMFADKRKAVKRNNRIPENKLWLLAWIGGAAGCTAGMFVFRHKTKQTRFNVFFPLLMLLQGLVVVMLLEK